MDALIVGLMRGPAAPKGSALADFVFFCLVGLAFALAAFGAGGLLVALRTGLGDETARIGAILAVMLPVYLTHRRFVFMSWADHRIAAPRYALVLAGAALCALTLFDVLSLRLGLDEVLAGILALAVPFVLAFFAMRRWVFAPR